MRDLFIVVQSRVPSSSCWISADAGLAAEMFSFQSTLVTAVTCERMQPWLLWVFCVWMSLHLNDTNTLTATGISVRIIRSQPRRNEDLQRKKSVPLLLSGSRPREPLLPRRRREERLKSIRPARHEIHAGMMNMEAERSHWFDTPGPQVHFLSGTMLFKHIRTCLD